MSAAGGARRVEGNTGERKTLSDQDGRTNAAVAGHAGGSRPPHHFSPGQPEPPSPHGGGVGRQPPWLRWGRAGRWDRLRFGEAGVRGGGGAGWRDTGYAFDVLWFRILKKKTCLNYQ